MYKLDVTAPHYGSFQIGDIYRVDDWKK